MRMMDTVRTMLSALDRMPMPSDDVLKDLALTRDDFQVLRNAPAGSRERMVFMAERFGVSERRLDAERWASLEMAQRCANCGVTDSCERLRNGQTTRFSPAQCPNAARFSKLTI